MEFPERPKRLGMVARWKPVHRGHEVVLKALLQRAEHVLVGLGSCNRYDSRNPFTAAESRAMIEGVTGAPHHLTLFEVPDLGDGPRWREQILDLFGPLDFFATANPDVRDLLKADYQVVHPVHLLPPEQRVAVSGTMVREAMLAGGAWQDLVPDWVADYLETNGLVERFRREFG